MAYPPLSPSRRPRRRITVVILIILSLAAGVIALAVRFRTERRDSVDYLAIAKEVSDDHVVLASGLADLFATMGDLERPNILDRLAGLFLESDAMRKALAEATVTAAVGEANGYFVVAITSWNNSLGSLDEAIIEILDGEGDGRLGDSMLAEAFNDLRVGDRAYQHFRESLGRIDADLVTRQYSDFGYVTGEREILFDPDVIANSLRSTLRFVENRDVSVRATTDPEPLGDENGIRVVPDSDSFSVQLVVTNEGNVTAELITVGLRLTAAVADASEERSEIVALLEPGQATTVLFPDFVLVPAVVYELQATVDIPDDDVPDNNSWELIFIQNAP